MSCLSLALEGWGEGIKPHVLKENGNLGCRFLFTSAQF